MGTQYGASSKPMRREPPMPLGNTVNYFSVSAATPPGATHPSGVSLRLKLDNPHQDASFRSNQLVNGRVLIQSPKSLQIPNLSLRVYFESRTLYWNLEVQDPENKVGRAISGIKSPATLNYDTVMRHEVHRGVVPASGVMLSWDAQIALEPDRDTVLPFSFIIPQKMRITEHSNNPYAPRDLCTVERCPPSTLRDSRFGSVQWVVEAVMDLTPSPTTKQDLDALLRQSTDDQIVTRIAFPFVPILEHVLPLRGEPFFGEDPSLDPFGSRRLSDEELESGKKAMMDREFLFDDQSSSSSPAGFTVSHEDPEPVEVDLTLDLQSEVSSKDHPSIPVKNLTPSFRTPNFQHEFLLTVLLSFVEDEVERFPTRFTVQVMPASDGDGGQLPAFEDAIRDNVPPPTFDESLNSS
ncbi:unnamed protein product [Rhizoctonia solani]|uniref:Uncharacterized protein n=1 Tax=Rhizoctonia solani TaxID=456999 RepID=A0A8H2W5U0_9AGAM|nr:unnamed protein product [Rhizoctonia solani]